MGWKGTLRSVNTELKRQSREADKRHRQRLKEMEREDAHDTVAEHESYLEEIVSLHHECRASLDWKSIETKPQPKAPEKENSLTVLAADKLENYKPNILVRILNLENRNKKKLADRLLKVKLDDEADFLAAEKKYMAAESEWKKNQELAKRIKTDGEAIMEVLLEHLEINDLPIGKDVQFEVSDDMQVDVNLKVFPFEDVIPEDVYSLRQSGTLSTKKMPKARGLELYQDHVCSALLRVARETLGVLPFDMVRANALMSAVNTQTGHLEDQTIISSIVVRDTLHQINLKKIDPSASLSNFVHSMNFKKTKGFSVVGKAKI